MLLPTNVTTKQECVKTINNLLHGGSNSNNNNDAMTELTKEITKKELKSTCRISTPYEPHETMVLPEWEEFTE